MKWNQLEAELTEAEIELVRHDYGRKECVWDSEGTVELTQELVNKLGVMENVDPESSPFDELPEPFAGGIFVAKLTNGKMFLVNTEGYPYSRYIAKAKVVPSERVQTQWEVKFRGDFAPRVITAANFDAAYMLVRQLEPTKELVYIQYLAY